MHFDDSFDHFGLDRLPKTAAQKNKEGIMKASFTVAAIFAVSIQPAAAAIVPGVFVQAETYFSEVGVVESQVTLEQNSGIASASTSTTGPGGSASATFDVETGKGRLYAFQALPVKLSPKQNPASKSTTY